MKSHSPMLMGAVIFTANLGMQVMAEGNEQVDVYRAVAIAILAGIFFYVIAPLISSKEVLAEKRLDGGSQQERPRKR